MSALPPRATVEQTLLDVSKGPLLDSCSAANQPAASFDHLVGAGKQHARHGKAERLGGFEVDDKLKFSRVLDGEIARSGPTKDFVDVDRSASENIGYVDSIRISGRQSPRSNGMNRQRATDVLPQLRRSVRG